MKFLHTMGAIGLMGGMACLVAVISVSPPLSSPPAYAATVGVMSVIATWILFPALAVTLISGLLAIAVNPGFHDAAWAWLKAATGILLFEGGLLYVVGPIQDQAKRSAGALAGHLSAAPPALPFAAERGTLWLLLAVTTANVVLGVWRPRLFPRSA
jgi:hypothetical protein